MPPKGKKFERLCVICCRGDQDDRMLGPLVHLRQISAHVNCVFFSPVTPDPLSRRNDSLKEGIGSVTARFIRGEAQRAKLTCNYCHAIGANAGCCWDTGTDLVVKFCNKKYHIDCGLTAGASFTVSKDRGTVSLCFNHRDHLERAPESIHEVVPCDTGAGNESVINPSPEAVAEEVVEYDVGLDEATGGFDAEETAVLRAIIDDLPAEDPFRDGSLAGVFFERNGDDCHGSSTTVGGKETVDADGLNQSTEEATAADNGFETVVPGSNETAEIKDIITDPAEDPLRDGSLAASISGRDEGDCYGINDTVKTLKEEEVVLPMCDVSLNDD